MSAWAFILLMIFIMALLVGAYYIMICYPVICNKTQPKIYDPERNYLIPTFSDHNDNNKESLPTLPNGGPPVAADAPPPTNDVAYPTAPNTSKSPNEEDSFASCDVPYAADDEGGKRPLDVPDCHINRVPEYKCSPKQENLQQCRPGSNGTPVERSPLLQGDAEDGLILCQPSVRSKNTGEPIPPLSPVSSDPLVSIVSPMSRSDPKISNSAPLVIQMQPTSLPEVNSSSIHDVTPDAVDPYPIGFVAPVEQAPSHVIVNIAQPLAVPPEKNISIIHPATHVVVTMPQPLNVPPLMVAPMYDEPPMDEQPGVSLQQQLHSIAPLPVTTPLNDAPVIVLLETHEEKNALPDDMYGWNECVITTGDTDNTPEYDYRTDVFPTRVKEDLEKSKTSTPNDGTVEITIDEVVSSAPAVEEDVTPNVVVLKMHSDNDFNEDSTKAADELPEDTRRSKHNSGEGSQQSSDPDITEYTFETGHLLTSTSVVLADEISATSEVGPVPNVKIVKYTSFDDSIVLNADASIGDSMRVLVGDPIDADISATEEMKNQCSSPDFTIPRRSPDGDSMKSIDGEAFKSFPISSPPSPVKDDKLNVQTTTQEKKETEIH